MKVYTAEGVKVPYVRTTARQRKDAARFLFLRNEKDCKGARAALGPKGRDRNKRCSNGHKLKACTC